MKYILKILISCICLLLCISGYSQSSLKFKINDSREFSNIRSAEEISCSEGFLIPAIDFGQTVSFKIEVENSSDKTILFSDNVFFSKESNPNFKILSPLSKKALAKGATTSLTIQYSNSSYFPNLRTELIFTKNDGSTCSINLQLFEEVAFLEVTKIDRLNGARVYRGGTIPFELKIKNIGDGDLNNLQIETPMGDYLSIESGSIRTSPLAIDDEYMGMMGGLNVDAISGVKANDFDDDLPNTTIMESGSTMSTAEGGSVTLQDNGSFIYSPPASPPASGMDMFIYTLIDGNPMPGVVDNNDAKVTILLNNAPVADDQMVMFLEDAYLELITLTGMDPDMDMITYLVVDGPTKGMLSGTAPNLSYTPDPDEYGDDSFTFKVNDGLVDSPLATVNIFIKPVNDVPSFTKGADESVLEDAGAQTVTGWATAISPGPSTEAGQMVSFNITGNTNMALFSSQPSIDPSGNLTYTPADDANGSATITLEAIDDGGNANGGVDTSPSQMFTVTVNPVNDAPTITCGPNQVVVNTDGAQSVVNWATGISTGPGNESQTAAITVANDNNALFSIQPAVATNGTLTYTPAGGSTGLANVTVTISDGIVIDDYSCSVTITVQAVPIAQDDAFQSKLDTDITGLSLFVDNGNGADDLGSPAATITHFGGGSLGGSITDNVTGTMVALAGGFLQVNANGTFSLTGQPFTVGMYTFDYRLTNAAGTSDATVTINVTPLEDPAMCMADSYNGTGNIAIDINAAAGVLNNDGGTNLVVEAVEGSSVNVGVATAATNGTVTCNADGSFTFEPTAGATTGSFQYTVDNSLNMPQTCTATINFTQMIWFIDVASAGTGVGGNVGTFVNPFKTIAAFNAVNNGAGSNPADGDYISLSSGTYSETDGVNLLNNQTLIGEGVQLSSHFTAHVNSISGYTIFAGSTGTRPIIIVSGVGNNGIDVRSNNTIRGLNIGATSINNFGISDFSPVGTLTISELSITGTGGTLELDNGGVLDVNIGELTGSSSSSFISTLTITNDFTGSFSTTSGTLTNTGPAVNIDGNLLTLNVVLTSVSSDGGANGVLIQDVSGSFSITGTASTSGSGGTIQNHTDDGIRITNASNITFSNILVQNCGDAVNEHGIELTQVTGTIDFNNVEVNASAEKNVEIEMTSGSMSFTADGCTFRDTQSSGTGADGLEFGIRGTATATIDIDNCSFLRNRTNGLQVLVENTAQVTKCDVTNNVFDSEAGIGIGLDLSTNNSASMTYNVIGNSRIRSRNGSGINSAAFGTSAIYGRIQNNSDIWVQSGGGSPVAMGVENGAVIVVEIDGNTLTGGPNDFGISCRATNASGSGNRIDATINNNRITIPNTAIYDIELLTASPLSTVCGNVTNNITSGAAIAAFRCRENTGTLLLQGFNTNAMTTWNDNGNTPMNSVSESPAGSASGGTCTTVTHPLP